MPTTKTQQSTFAERVQKAEEQESYFHRFSAEAKYYYGNPVRTFTELSSNLFPTDEYNQKAYTEAIIDSLSKTISPEIGIMDFWNQLENKDCQKCVIEDGVLHFYTSLLQKIDITQFTQKIVFEAQSSFYKQRQKERMAKIAEAKKQLQELKNTIKK